MAFHSQFVAAGDLLVYKCGSWSWCVLLSSDFGYYKSIGIHLTRLVHLLLLKNEGLEESQASEWIIFPQTSSCSSLVMVRVAQEMLEGLIYACVGNSKEKEQVEGVERSDLEARGVFGLLDFRAFRKLTFYALVCFPK